MRFAKFVGASALPWAIANLKSVQHLVTAATDSRPVLPATSSVAPRSDPDAVGRTVIKHLRQLESRSSPRVSGQVMSGFLKDTSIRLGALKEAVNQQDATAVDRLAHTLYRSSATVGAVTMVSTCAEIIRQVRCGLFDSCDDLLNDLALDFEAIRQAAEESRIADPSTSRTLRTES